MKEILFSSDNPGEDYDNGDNEEKVDKATYHMKADESDEPENDKDNSDSKEHRVNIRNSVVIWLYGIFPMGYQQ